MQRKILEHNCTRTGYGTHHYNVKYQGEWDDWALINCIDKHLTHPTEEQYEYYNKDCCMNWGGYVKRLDTDENGITTAKVGINYE